MTYIHWYTVIPWYCQSLLQTHYLRCHGLLVECIDNVWWVDLDWTGMKAKSFLSQRSGCSFSLQIQTRPMIHAIGGFISANMWPYFIRQNSGFKHLLRVLEFCYNAPSHVHVSQSIVLLCINEQLFKNNQHFIVLRWRIADIFIYFYLFYFW